MTSTRHRITIGSWFQGPTGSGQGGWTAQRFAERLDGPATFAIKAPVPLDTELTVVADDGGRRLLADQSGEEPAIVMTAEPWVPRFPTTAAVSIEDAAEARARFDSLVDEHPVPFCFSCGTQQDSMRVHAGPLDDDHHGRFATDWRVPDWAVSDDGRLDEGALWAALDCTAAWYVGYSRKPRLALTVQYAVEVLEPLKPGATYALVGWSGDHDPDWDGRKRHGASAAFAADGTCVARSVSFWIASV